jgi:hypothetical protein
MFSRPLKAMYAKFLFLNFVDSDELFLEGEAIVLLIVSEWRTYDHIDFLFLSVFVCLALLQL